MRPRRSNLADRIGVSFATDKHTSRRAVAVAHLPKLITLLPTMPGEQVRHGEIR